MHKKKTLEETLSRETGERYEHRLFKDLHDFTRFDYYNKVLRHGISTLFLWILLKGTVLGRKHSIFTFYSEFLLIKIYLRRGFLK